MSTLYHYCNVNSLKEILKNKTLRLSDIRKSNDPREITFLFEEYRKWIKDNFKDNELDFVVSWKSWTLVTQL